MLDDIFETNHRRPEFAVKVITKDKNKQDITEIVTERLISLNLTDNRGMEADQLDIILSDHDGALALPPRNAEIELAIGWKGKMLTHKGKFTIDEVQWAGSPDTLTLRGRSADIKGSLGEQKSRSWHEIHLDDLVEQIAKEHGLDSFVDFSLRNPLVAHIDQTTESDASFLTRLAEQYGCFLSVKNGVLLFMEAGRGKTASGKPIPVAEITRQSGDSFQFSLADGENYKAVRAYWHDTDTGLRGEITVDENTKITKQQKMTKGRQLKNGTVKGARLSKRKYNVVEQTAPITTDADKIKTLRHVYATDKSAINAAKAAFGRIKRGVASFSLNLAYGDAELVPERPVSLRGFKSAIDSTDWIISRVTHNIDGNGFTTSLELELKPDDGEGIEVKTKK